MQISVMMKKNDTPPPALDIDAVRAFVLVADLQNSKPPRSHGPKPSPAAA
jgi:hypothetical protein